MNPRPWFLFALSVSAFTGCSEPPSQSPATAPRATEAPLRPPADASTAEFLDETSTLHREGRFQEGVARLEEELRLDPERPRLHYNLGVFRASLGEYEAAAAAFEEELAHFPGHPESHRALAAAYTRLGRLDDSIPHYEACLLDDADDALCAFGLGRNFSALGLFEEARGPLERAAELRSDAAAYAELGALYRRLGYLDRAMAAFAKGLADDPRHLATLLGYGQVLTAAGRQQDGETLLERHQHLATLQDQLNAFERTQAQSGASAAALLDLARLHLERGDRPAAAAAYREVLKLDERNAFAALELAALSLEDDRLEEAERWVALAESTDRESPAPSFIFALLHLKRGDGQTATQAIAASRRLGGWPITAYNDLGEVLYEVGDFPSAIQVLSEGLRSDPRHAPLHYNLARTHHALGDRDAAAGAARQATRLDPNFAEAWTLLGSLLFEAGDVPEADAAFRRVLDLERLTLLQAGGGEQLLRGFPGSEKARDAFRSLLSEPATD